MQKSRYFCDRCGAEASSRCSLYEVTLQLEGRNPLQMDICSACTKIIVAVLARQTLASQRAAETP
jgi:hypothetical protein